MINTRAKSLTKTKSNLLLRILGWVKRKRFIQWILRPRIISAMQTETTANICSSRPSKLKAQMMIFWKVNSPTWSMRKDWEITRRVRRNSWIWLVSWPWGPKINQCSLPSMERISLWTRSGTRWKTEASACFRQSTMQIIPNHKRDYGGAVEPPSSTANLNRRSSKCPARTWFASK